MTITEFLLDRIAEDEALARAAIEDDGGYDEGFSGQYEALVLPPSGVGYASGGFGRDAARMITTYAVPRRVLAECAAKRAIVGLHKECQRESYENASAYLLDALNHLAAIYADHPDYQQEWSVGS